ncbi:MAG: hypothetical protein M1837_003414 [Sclerophora amabilis]|nr:MAG: hypothetical protein M1837_003414 [Sclerophora amabilis]
MSNLRDNVDRRHGSSPVGKTVFCGLRLLDSLLQYTILSRHVLASFVPMLLGGSLAPPAVSGTTTLLGLSPYQLLILSMAIGSSIKHTFWVIFISQQQMPVGLAFTIAGINTVMNSLNTVFSLWSRTSPYSSTDPSWASVLQNAPVLLGLLFYITGILVETSAEIQRSRFKRDSRNAGKPYGSGLFGWARNINYGGYTLWRSGYSFAAAGPVWGVTVGSFFFHDFATRGVPVLDKYCQQRYGDAWTEIRKRVPDVLFPGLY